jgi:hypothetical protein
VDLLVRVLAAYGRYVVTVVVLGLAVALVLGLRSCVVRWWDQRYTRKVTRTSRGAESEGRL